MSSLKFILFVFACVIISQGLTVDHADHKKFRSDLNTLRKEELKRHNQYRKSHQVPPLQLDDALNKEAQKIAEKIAKANKFI